jgi:hypothetical protein
MMKLFFIAWGYLSIAGLIYGKANIYSAMVSTTQKTLKDTAIEPIHLFQKIETEAQFTGGQKAWQKFLEKKLEINVPIKNGAPAGMYTVVIEFIVDTSGYLSQFKPLTNFGYGMEVEVIRVLEKSPVWIPGTLNGKKVPLYKKQPVSFNIPSKQQTGLLILKK